MESKEKCKHGYYLKKDCIECLRIYKRNYYRVYNKTHDISKYRSNYYKNEDIPSIGFLIRFYKQKLKRLNINRCSIKNRYYFENRANMLKNIINNLEKIKNDIQPIKYQNRKMVKNILVENLLESKKLFLDFDKNFKNSKK